MIPVTIYLAYLLALLFCAGCVFRQALKCFGTTAARANRSEPETEVSETLLLGLVLVTVIASVVSLFHAINLTVHLTVSALLLALGGRDLTRFLKNCSFEQMGMRTWSLRFAGFICLGLVVFAATDKVANYDTGLYHAQVVKWTTGFAVVPGLANLQGRLGYNSAWHVFASFVDQGYFSGLSSHVVGLVICVILLLACFQGFQRWLDGDRSTGTLLRASGLLVVIANRSSLNALSTDWPTAVLLYYTLILTVERVEGHMAAKGRQATPLWEARLVTATVVSVFAVMVKLSSIPILLLLLPWLWFAQDKGRATMLMLVPAILIVAPFVMRSVVLTGYVVYPFATVDLFSFDWKVPQTDVQLMTTILKYWAINPVDDWYRAMDMNLWEQFQTWLKWRRREIISVIPWFLIGVLGWIGASIQTKARLRVDFFMHSAICCTLLAGIAFCLAKAPEPRYAAGWFLAFGLFSATWLCHVTAASLNVSGRAWKLTGYLVLAGCMLWSVQHAGVKRLLREKGEPIWKLNDMPMPEMKEVRSEHGVIVKVPVNDDRSWNAALPTTTPLGFNPWLQMRGQTLSEGFRVTKPGFGVGRESILPRKDQQRQSGGWGLEQYQGTRVIGEM